MRASRGRGSSPVRRAPAARQGGFSLIELVVSIVIMAEILIGVAILFDSSNKLARSQNQVAELQQSLRVGQSEVVRFARMAGLGGLPITRLVLPAGEPSNPGDYGLLGAFPRGGYAVSVLNKAGGEATALVDIGKAIDGAAAATGDRVLPKSDVLILRGVFTTPLYYFDDPLDITGWAAAGGQVTIYDRADIKGKVWEGYPQNIAALGARLTAASAANRPVALILRDTLNPNAFAIMEYDWQNTNVGDLTSSYTLAKCGPPPPGADLANCIRFLLRLDPITEPGNSYGKLASGSNLEGGQAVSVPDPPNPALDVQWPTSVGSIGLLEEFRFFVRVDYEVPGDEGTRLTPVLSRSSFLPGADIEVDRIDIADNVIDLQIAVGMDCNGDGTVTENTAVSDEVLFNQVADTDPSDPFDIRIPPNAAPILDPPDPAKPACTAVNWYDLDEIQYHFLRINTLVQSRLPNRDIVAPNLAQIEDLNRGAAFTFDDGGSPHNYLFNNERSYHRRWLQTVVELRNLQ